jgi:hypothetical protein
MPFISGGRNVQVPHIARGKDGEGDFVAAQREARQRAGALDFDVIGMSGNGQDFHDFREHLWKMDGTCRV